MLELPLPEVDAEHVTVQADNEICHGNPESRTQPEELWRSLEGPLLSGEPPLLCPCIASATLLPRGIESLSLASFFLVELLPCASYSSIPAIQEGLCMMRSLTADIKSISISHAFLKGSCMVHR